MMDTDKYPFEEYAPDQWWLHELRSTGEFTDDLKRAIGVAVNFSDTAFRKVAGLQAEIERLKSLLGTYAEFVESAPVESGVCCCGGDMAQADHGDHSAVDQWGYSLSKWREEFDKLGVERKGYEEIIPDGN